MNSKYNMLNTNPLLLENANTIDVVQSIIESTSGNRKSRRSYERALGKMENRQRYYEKQRAEDSETFRKEYQRLVDEKIKEADNQLFEKQIDNWKKSTALAAILLKRKYNWNVGRVQTFITKMNDLHIEMIDNGEWDNILQILDNECDIQLATEEELEDANNTGED